MMTPKYLYELHFLKVLSWSHSVGRFGTLKPTHCDFSRLNLRPSSVSRRQRNLIDSGFPATKRGTLPITTIQNELLMKGLHLLQTDKSSKFAVLPVSLFESKKTDAVVKLLKPFPGNLQKSKLAICSMLMENDMSAICKAIRSASRSTLSVKFLLKDHKVDMPLRIVVNENHTWQKVVSSFIKNCLSSIYEPSPLVLKNSESLLEALASFHGKKCHALSLDIKDLYYSLRADTLLNRVRDFLECNLVRFQSKAGISVSDFLRVLELYLKSTAISIDGELFTQKTGICIGSAIAPVLSEIYLRAVDTAVLSFISTVSTASLLVRRFVDDLLLLSNEESIISDCERVIRSVAPELDFTVEYPMNGELQFLDVRLLFSPYLCWNYGKTVPKPILPASSCHSKTVKFGVIAGLLSNAVKKSCVHQLHSSLCHQLSRLRDAGYSHCMIFHGLMQGVEPQKIRVRFGFGFALFCFVPVQFRFGHARNRTGSQTGSEPRTGSRTGSTLPFYMFHKTAFIRKCVANSLLLLSALTSLAVR
ncbi:uncharacterized protein LOC135375945 [Ornithodoros turicata]|uniref:uncharacterized protein LOC135375945 n=1 Tax=Ornithodoros turicata TaxID=34597 RepID=UPI0031396B99